MDNIENYSTALLQDLSSHTTPAASRLRDRHRKRFLAQTSDLDAVAVTDFISDNSKVVQRVDLPSDVIDNARDFIANALESYTRRNYGGCQEVLNLPGLLTSWAFGPGASNGVKSTHFCDKLDEDIVCTERAYPLVKMLRSLNPHLKLDDIKNRASCRKVKYVKGAKLACVPKNQETARTISKQPLWNMALQLAIGNYISSALRGVGTDLENQQEKNRKLAKEGSVSGLISTIDLKSASNYFSFALIESLWPIEFVELFKITRSEFVQIGDDIHKVNMVSMMGNGFTFPMMTMTLLALVYATSTRSQKRFFVDYSCTGVFGDDIIIPTCDFTALCDVLTQSGLIVNEAKSYTTGPFRESCGGDYYEGCLITPFYVTSLRTDQEVYVAINKVLDWSAKHRIYLFDTLQYLLSLLIHRNVVPEWENPDSGILSGAPLPSIYQVYLPIRRLRPLRSSSEHNEMLCVLGGYVTVVGQRRTAHYAIRSVKLKYEIKNVKRPNGFITGRSPLFYSERESILRDSMLRITL